MERHFTYTQSLFSGPIGAEAEKFVAGVLLCLILFLLGKTVTKRINSADKIKQELVPARKFDLFSFFDLFTEKFIQFHDSIVGKENRKYFPLSASIFLFIFIANLIGLFPGMPAITTTVWINVGMAILVFIVFNIYGIRENGIVNYVKHMVGGNAMLNELSLLPKKLVMTIMLVGIIILLFCIETISLFLRVLTLNLRLYWNITADHTVLSIFNDFLGVVLATPFYGLGLFVSFIQAFVFTLLTMLYINLAVAHEGEEH